MNLFAKKSPLEIYIRQVKSYLPRKNGQDIADEIRANLEEKIEDTEATAGSPLNEEQLVALLSDHGHPIRVAAQYQGQGRSLIGPDFYPFYKMSIIVALSLSTVIMLLLITVEALFELQLGGVSKVWMFANTYIYIVGIITAIYFITERLIERNSSLEKWNLRAIDNENSPQTKALNAIVSGIFLITLLIILNMVDLEHSFAVLIGQTQNPLHTLVFWMQIQLVVLIPQYIYLVFNQAWTRNRIFLRSATELILIVGCVITLSMDLEPVAATYPEIPAQLYTAFRVTLFCFIAAGFISIIVYIRKGTREINENS